MQEPGNGFISAGVPLDVPELEPGEEAELRDYRPTDDSGASGTGILLVFFF
jgi:hypothetical protein